MHEQNNAELVTKMHILIFFLCCLPKAFIYLWKIFNLSPKKSENVPKVNFGDILAYRSDKFPLFLRHARWKLGELAPESLFPFGVAVVCVRLCLAGFLYFRLP